MHPANREWWKLCEAKYTAYFKNVSRVLEVGSLNVNGSVRDHFDDVDTYIGLDWRPGPLVDVVSLAQDMDFDEPFNTIISCSMLEHDPYWDASLAHMVKFLRDDGGLFLSWGASRCAPHELHTAPDGKYHALPAGKVLKLVDELGLYVHEFQYESAMKCRQGTELGWGEVALVAFKDKQYALGESYIAPLLEVDEV